MTRSPSLDITAMRSRAIVRWMRRILFIAGALATAYVAVTLLHAKLYQKAADSTLENQSRTQEQSNAIPMPAVASEGGVVGRIEIPRLGISVAILEGTTSRTLRLGVGHIAQTSLPGQPGNIGIAGHRDTYFRALKDTRTNDMILIQTAIGVTHYKVDWIRIVAPGDTGVLAPSMESALTLVTCYPFYFIGASPKRYIVHALRIQ